MNKQTTLKITGMTCASCAATVKKALSSIAGVSEVNVNIATEKTTVKYDPSMTGEADLIKGVGNAGYVVATDEVTLGLISMSCVSCAGAIEDALKGAEGIISVSVNFATINPLVNPRIQLLCNDTSLV